MEVKREHLKLVFLAGDDNVADILLDADKGAAFNVVEPPVGDKMLYGLPRHRETLDFVEDHAGLPLYESGFKNELQPEEKIRYVPGFGKRLFGIGGTSVGH